MNGRSGLARAAGAVVYRAAKRETQYLLIHRPRYDDWSLPKGHLDNGESFEAAALREVEEETGFTGELGPHLGSIGYRARSDKQKVVRYWLLAATKGKFVPNKEADAAKWLPLSTARKLATYTRDANLLGRAERQLTKPKAAEVHLVRHAHAGRRSAWEAPDYTRPLSEKGRRQAAAIRNRLLKLPIDSVHSSYHVRCDATVRPVADALDLEVDHEPSLAEATPTEETLEFLGKLRGTTAMLCSHGDVVSGLIGELAAEGVDFEGPQRWEKGSVWTLDLHKGRVIGGRYSPPPSS